MTEPINEIGATAFIIAAYRAAEKEHPHCLFTDDYAKYFINSSIVQKANDFANIIPEGKEMIRYRVRFFSDVITDYVANGVTQVVMLGCGFDMRSQQYNKAKVQFFDVDQAAVLAFKQKVIKANNINYSSKFVVCNYITDDVVERLISQGFDTKATSLFIWEGNVHYIPKPKVYNFLKHLNKNVANFSLAFDYLSEKVITRQSGIEAGTKAADFFADMGSPWVTGFDSLDELKKESGLVVSQNLSMVDLAKIYNAGIDAPEMLKLYSTAIFATN